MIKIPDHISHIHEKDKGYFILAFILFSIFSFSIRNNILLGCWYLISIIYILIHIDILRQVKISVISVYSGLIIFSALATLPFSFYKTPTALLHFFTILLTILLSTLFSLKKISVFNSLKYSLLLTQALTILYLTFTSHNETPLEYMIPNSSTNGITSYLIIMQGCYSIINFLLYRSTSLFTSSITSYICIIGFGRGSLIAAFLIAGINIVFFCIKHYRVFIKLIPVMILIVFFYGNKLVDNTMYFLEINTKISATLYDSVRVSILKEYTNKIDTVNFFIGADYKNTDIEHKFNNNPHSSYIRAHYLFGIFYLAINISSILLIIFSKNTIAVKTYSFLMYCIMLFRAATEPILFPTILDLLYYSTLFLILRVQTRTPHE